MATGTLTNGTLALSQSAFETEHKGKFDEALKLHRSAIAELERSTHDGKVFRTDEVRLVLMQVKIHIRRCEAIEAAFSRKKTTPDTMLPTLNSAIDQVVEYITNGKTHIGFVSRFLQSKSTVRITKQLVKGVETFERMDQQ